MLVEKIDIKSDMPPMDVAVATLEIKLDVFQKEGVKVVIVIHGYGSHGTGGEIKKGVQLLLKRLKSEHKIAGFVKGESWGDKAIRENDVLNKFPSLILDADLKNYNSGITVIFL